LELASVTARASAAARHSLLDDRMGGVCFGVVRRDAAVALRPFQLQKLRAIFRRSRLPADLNAPVLTPLGAMPPNSKVGINFLLSDAKSRAPK
jgi:hypothetical protein